MCACCITGVHSKNLVAILHLLVALARHFNAPIRLPENVVVTLVVIQVSAIYSTNGFYSTLIYKLNYNHVKIRLLRLILYSFHLKGLFFWCSFGQHSISFMYLQSNMIRSNMDSLNMFYFPA